jgi:hypothetical protein
MPKLPGYVIAIIVGIIGLVSFFAVYGYINGLRNDSVNREVPLSRSYETLKTGLDAFLTTAREQAGVTKAQSAAFDKIMLDAVAGRYQGKEGGPTGVQPTGGSMFSAIQEAYPNLDKVSDSYTRILDTISSGRTAFANNQAKLQDQLREYDTWRKTDYFRSWVLAKFIGVPSENLVVNNGDQKLRGQQAYDKMSAVITSGVTSGAFKSGTLEAQDFFKE